jgi:hypothetical protein
MLHKATGADFGAGKAGKAMTRKSGDLPQANTQSRRGVRLDGGTSAVVSITVCGQPLSQIFVTLPASCAGHGWDT